MGEIIEVIRTLLHFICLVYSVFLWAVLEMGPRSEDPLWVGLTCQTVTIHPCGHSAAAGCCLAA